MSLKFFHIFFVLISALLCGGFAWWLKGAGSGSFGSANTAVMLLSASGAGALLIYLIKVVNIRVTTQN